MHKFSPDRAPHLERPERRARLQPGITLRLLGVRPGMTVVDVGAGTGFFARESAHIVGGHGRVFATDMSERMLAFMLSNGIPENTTVLQSTEYQVPLPDGIADAVLAAFVFHETPDRQRFLEELMRLLKRGGRLIVLEWKRQEEADGPPRDERLSEEELDRTLASEAVISRGMLNSSHYFRVVQKP